MSSSSAPPATISPSPASKKSKKKNNKASNVSRKSKENNIYLIPKEGKICIDTKLTDLESVSNGTKIIKGKGEYYIYKVNKIQLRKVISECQKWKGTVKVFLAKSSKVKDLHHNNNKRIFTKNKNRIDLKLKKEEKDISIFTYNVCWECMTGFSSEQAGIKASALELGKKCYPEKCKNNIINLIKSRNDDIILLQEWVDNSYKKENYEKILHSTGLEKMLSLINTNRFDIIEKNNLAFTTSRPMSIIYLKDKKSEEEIILINIHNSHHNTLKSKLERKIPNVLKKYFNITSKSKLDNLRFILAGDTNRTESNPNDIEKNGNNFNLELKLELDLGIKRTINLRANASQETCCDSKNGKRFNKISDFIFDSKKSANNKVVNIEGLASDHLPVEAVLI